MEKGYLRKIGVRAGMAVLMILLAINLLVGVGNAKIVFTESDCPSVPCGADLKLNPYPFSSPYLSCDYLKCENGARVIGGTEGASCDMSWFPSINDARKKFELVKGGKKGDLKEHYYENLEILSDAWGSFVYYSTWSYETGTAPDSHCVEGCILYKNYVFWIQAYSADSKTAKCVFNSFERSLMALADRKGVIDDYEPHSPEVSEGPDDCFIATAAYGTPINKNINVLREFRDDVLIENYLGETFVRIYYLSSPPIADVLTSSEWMRTATRVLLITPLVYGTKTLLNSTFQFILGACLVVGLYLTRKYKSIAIMKSIGLGFLTAVIISMTVFILGYTGHSSPICAIIAAHILPIIIPVSLGVVALSLIYSSFLRRQ